MFCWFFRLIISHSNDVDRPVTGITKNHIDKCSDCRQFYHICNSLGKTLLAEAKILGQKYPSVSEERIMQNISKSETNYLTIRTKFRPMTIAAVNVLILAIGIMLLPSERQTVSNDDFDNAVADITGLIDFDGGRIISGLIEEPLDTELQNIIADTKSAAYFFLACVGVDAREMEEIEQFE